MAKKLYFVCNNGCDDTTHGLVEVCEEQQEQFFQFIRDLNRNSSYGCMPTISLYEVSWDDFKEVPQPLETDIWGENYIEPRDRLYFNGKIFTYKNMEGEWMIYRNGKELKFGEDTNT